MHWAGHMAKRKKSGNTQGRAQKAVDQNRGWVVVMARLGYTAKGLVYLVMGGTAARAAFRSDEPEGAKGAVTEMLGHPIGAMLVVLIMAGLVGYSLWRLLRATVNPENDSVGSRLYSVMTATVHLALFGTIASAVWHDERGGSEGAEHWTARAFAQPLGRWLVLAIGIGFLMNGFWQIYKAITTKLDDDLDLGRMNDFVRWVTRAGARAGMTARGVVFGLIGGSLGLAAAQVDASEARGIGRVLDDVLNAPYGQFLLGAIATGFIAYGTYELLRAVYRRVRT